MCDIHVEKMSKICLTGFVLISPQKAENIFLIDLQGSLKLMLHLCVKNVNKLIASGINPVYYKR